MLLLLLDSKEALVSPCFPLFGTEGVAHVGCFLREASLQNPHAGSQRAKMRKAFRVYDCLLPEKLLRWLSKSKTLCKMLISIFVRSPDAQGETCTRKKVECVSCLRLAPSGHDHVRSNSRIRSQMKTTAHVKEDEDKLQNAGIGLPHRSQ